jgi:hypothetical protein
MKTSFYAMSDMCTCGNSYGKHIGLDCPDGKRHFILVEDVPRGVPVEDKPAVVYQCDGYTVEVTAEAINWIPNATTQTAPTKERTRPALDWADSKRVDRFADFIVERFDADDGMPAAPDHSHPLQRIAQEGDQLHGSAFLRKGA